MAAVSACDTCPVPGKCCRFFSLNHSGGRDQWSGRPLLEAIAGVGASEIEDHPFVPLYRRPNGVTIWWCPNLGRDGRCMDYDRRPYTCRSFEPASDKLCVLWEPPAVASREAAEELPADGREEHAPRAREEGQEDRP